MTRCEFATYEKNVAAFMAAEGIDILGQEEQVGYFSWRPCDCCKSELGGDRYTMAGAKAGVGPNGCTYSVCTDCLYYSVYGTLDDATMMEMAR